MQSSGILGILKMWQNGKNCVTCPVSRGKPFPLGGARATQAGP